MQIAHGLAEHSSRYARFAQRLTRPRVCRLRLRPPRARPHVRRPRRLRPRGRVAERHRRPARRDRPGPRGAPGPAGLPHRPQHGLVPLAGVCRAATVPSSPASCSSGTAGGAGAIGKVGVFLACDAGPAARAQPHERPAEHADLRSVQLGLQADPHRLRLALARPRRGRQVRQRPRLRVRLQRRWFRRHAPRPRRASTPTGRPPACPRTCPSTSPRATWTRSAPTARACARSPTSSAELGVQDVTLTLWPEARHEILNETNRDEVEVEIVDWLDAHLPAGRPPVGRLSDDRQLTSRRYVSAARGAAVT